MGMSGKSGTVTKNGRQLNAEITKWDATPGGYIKEYGHDKSRGWQDVVAGIARVEGTIEVKLTRSGLDFGFGQVVYLRLYPFGKCKGRPIHGKAMIKETPISVTEEDGQPVSATYKWVSKLCWHGIPGAECDPCNGGGGSGASSGSGSGSSSGSGSGSGSSSHAV